MPEPTSYDTIAYPGRAYRDTHPNQLAATAMLFGLEPAPPEKCRVLDVGCSEGRNLISMAFSLPESEFVGFDLAAKPIARAQETITELGLKNIRVVQADIMELDDDWGQFDYIVAHGFYAWVPDVVRDRLLDLCRRLLKPNGVAFISYNAMPGCHIRLMLRFTMQYRLRGISDPAERAGKGKLFLQTLRDLLPDSPERGLVEDEIALSLEGEPNFMLHDELGDVYSPVSISSFIANAARHGLQYVSEVNFGDLHDRKVSESSLQQLAALAGGDLSTLEQYSDFLRLRYFRRSLVCHSGIRLRQHPPSSAVPKLFFLSPADMEPVPDAPPGTMRIVSHVGKSAIETDNPVIIAICRLLIDRWPRTAAFAEIISLAGGAPDTAVAELLTRLGAMSIIQFTARPSTAGAVIGEFPEASPLARYDVLHRPNITTLSHTMLLLSDQFHAALLPLLDGTRDRAALRREMSQLFPELGPETVAMKVEESLAEMSKGLLL